MTNLRSIYLDGKANVVVCNVREAASQRNREIAIASLCPDFVRRVDNLLELIHILVYMDELI
jgi:hypothetical protein